MENIHWTISKPLLCLIIISSTDFQNIQQLDGSESVGFQPNIGVGFKYKGIQVDYALTDIGDQSAALYSNIFSLKLDWSIFR